MKNETKEQKGGFLGMSLSTFSTSFLGNMLTCCAAEIEWSLFKKKCV